MTTEDALEAQGYEFTGYHFSIRTRADWREAANRVAAAYRTEGLRARVVVDGRVSAKVLVKGTEAQIAAAAKSLAGNVL